MVRELIWDEELATRLVKKIITILSCNIKHKRNLLQYSMFHVYLDQIMINLNRLKDKYSLRSRKLLDISSIKLT